MPLSLSAEKKVSKIHRIVFDEYDFGIEDYSETEYLTYDDKGRLATWKVIEDDGDVSFDQKIEYVSKDKVVISGIFDHNEGVAEVSLDENGLATSIRHYANWDTSPIIYTLSYSNGLISKYTYSGSGVEDASDFEITDGNPTRIISDYWWGDYPVITYSDKPNKCGLIYLPMITYNHEYYVRAVAYAGLQGRGSANLPYSCNFHPDRENDFVIDYVIDDEGYVTSMTMGNASDGDGHYTFEYCDVNTENAAIEAVSGNKNSVIVTDRNNIIVKGEYNSVKVYDISGMLCKSTTDLLPGIYIVAVDNTRFKVRIY